MANTIKCRLDELEPETRKKEKFFAEQILPEMVNMTRTEDCPIHGKDACTCAWGDYGIVKGRNL